MKSRNARLSDLEAVCAISRSQPRSAGWTAGQFQEELAGAGSFFRVADDGSVRAYAVFKLVGEEARLIDLAVAADASRRGLARALLGDSFRALGRKGIRRVTLEASQDNEPALRLYESLGFVVVGRRRKFYNDGSDAILMDLPLP